MKIGAPLVDRQHGRPQALRAHVAVGAAARASCQRDLPARRRQRRHRVRRRGRATRSSRTPTCGGSRSSARPRSAAGSSQRAAERDVKTITLELGGKNPIVVLPDADLDLAVDGVAARHELQLPGPVLRLDLATARPPVAARTTSSSGSKARLDAHPRRAARRATRPQMGAMVNRGQFEKVASYIRARARRRLPARDRRRPARRRRSSRTASSSARRCSTTSLPARGSRRRRSSGRCSRRCRSTSYDEALAIANTSRSASPRASSPATSSSRTRFARDVEAGYVWVNDSGPHFLGTPFGGVKDSGVGREEDFEELLSYTQIEERQRALPGADAGDRAGREARARSACTGRARSRRRPTLLDELGPDALAYCGGTELLLVAKLGMTDFTDLVDIKGIARARRDRGARERRRRAADRRDRRPTARSSARRSSARAGRRSRRWSAPSATSASATSARSAATSASPTRTPTRRRT